MKSSRRKREGIKVRVLGLLPEDLLGLRRLGEHRMEVLVPLIMIRRSLVGPGVFSVGPRVTPGTVARWIMLYVSTVNFRGMRVGIVL